MIERLEMPIEQFAEAVAKENGRLNKEIENLKAENGVLFAANVRLNSRVDIDYDHYADRIEQLEASEDEWNRVCNTYATRIDQLETVLQEIVKQIKQYDIPAPVVTFLVMQKIQLVLGEKNDD